MKKINILVFPCGSEVALEIFRSLKYSRHVNLIGANSVDDHGRFVYRNYIGGVPFIDDEKFIPAMAAIVREKNVDAIYPAMDQVASKLKNNEEVLGCKIIGSPRETTEICASKMLTYDRFKNIILVPKVYNSVEEIKEYPVFIKPDDGYGSRLAKKITTPQQAELHLSEVTNGLIMEYLPGMEYTIDCFSDCNRNLMFCGPRPRKRIANGISVNTYCMDKDKEAFLSIARKINSEMVMRGAWFFQLKQNYKGELALLEVAARLGGSSGLFRNRGVNFALLSIFDQFNSPVEVFTNNYSLEMDRSLNCVFKVDYEYSAVYVDYEDCLIIDGRVNEFLIRFLFQTVNDGKKVILLTKHGPGLSESLKYYRLAGLFDEIIQISKDDDKYKYVTNKDAIFIDDSFSERKAMRLHKNIPVFSPDMIDCLLKE